MNGASNPLTVGPIFDPIATARSYGFEDIFHYQEWHGLEVDGVAGPITTTLMSSPRCGIPDFQESRQPEKASWPNKCLDVSTAYKLRLNMDDDEVERAWNAALRLWNESCGIRLTLIDNMREASIWAKSGPLSGSTLAWSYLPNGDCSERLEQRYDSEQRWTHEFLAKTMLHEIGHALGLRHSNRKSDIMYPSIQSRPLSSYPSNNDKRRVVDYYGNSDVEPEAPETPEAPDTGRQRITVTGTLTGGTYTLAKI